MNPKLIKSISEKNQKRYKKAMIKFSKTGKVTKWLVYGNRYFLWLHHYLSTGKINVKKGVITLAK